MPFCREGAHNLVEHHHRHLGELNAVPALLPQDLPRDTEQCEYTTSVAVFSGISSDKAKQPARKQGRKSMPLCRIKARLVYDS